MSVIIGIVGEKGAGKETFNIFLQELLPDKTFSVVRFSDTLREMLDVLFIPHTRKNLQDIAIITNKRFGEGTVTRAVKRKLEKETADIVILDGVRWLTDAEMLRTIKDSILVYITANPQERFERLLKRGDKEGESDMSFEQFEHEEQKHTELFIGQIGQTADFKIDNNGSFDELKERISQFTKEKLGG